MSELSKEIKQKIINGRKIWDIEIKELILEIEQLETKLEQYQKLDTLDKLKELIYLRNRYEDESYDFCGEYGTEECPLAENVT